MDVYPAGNIQGGVLQPGETSAEWCYYTCLETTGCAGFDFDNDRRSCWLHTNYTECSPIDYHATVDHYRLIRCPGKKLATPNIVLMTTMLQWITTDSSGVQVRN